MEPDELFEVTGELQGAANAVEGAQLVAIAHAGSHETRLTERGPVEVHHELGFIDQMTSSEVSLATGVGQWAAGRKVGLAAALSSRFPRLLAKVMAGELAGVNAQKVVSVCDGLDEQACAAVESVLADRLVGMDPARVTTVARRVATRVAADQVAAATARNKGDRCVQVSPGPDGTTNWWAQLPAGRSAAAWEAVTSLGDEYAAKDPSLTVDQARADAFLDLVLTNVTVTAKVTLGIPVITGAEGEAARDAAIAEPMPPRVLTPATRTPKPGVLTTSTAQPHSSGRQSRPAASAWARSSPSPPHCCPGARSPASGSSTPRPSRRCSAWSPPTSAAPCSTPAPGRWSSPSPTPTDHRDPSPTSSPPATGPAGCGAAPAPPPAATSTTPARGPTGRPAPPTSADSVAATIDSSNGAAGPTSSTPTARRPGPHPAAPSASPSPTTPPCHHPRRPQSASGAQRELAEVAPPPF